MPDWVRFPLVLGIVGAVAALGLALIYGLTMEQIRASERRKVEGAFTSILGSTFARAEPKSAGEAGTYLDLKDGKDATVAYAAQVSCAGSYNAGEPVKLMVVLDTDLDRVLGVRVISSKETPGFGERINARTAPSSVWGYLVGRPDRSRVVLRASGTLVGIVEKKDDGSLRIVSSDGASRSVSAQEYAEVTEAPFPPAFVDQFTGIPLGQARLTRSGGTVDAITGATITSRAVVAGVAAAAERIKAAVRGSR